MDFWPQPRQDRGAPSTGARRSTGARGLARELALLGPMNSQEAPFDETSLLVPKPAVVEKELSRLVGRCDLIFRCAAGSTAGSTASASWPDGWSLAGAPVRRGVHFEAACACYRPAQTPCRPPTDFFAAPLAPNGVLSAGFEGSALDSISLLPDETDDPFTFDFDTFTAAARGMHVEEDAYGTAGDIVKLKMAAIGKFNTAGLMTSRFTGQVLRRANALVGERSVSDSAAGLELVNAYMTAQASPQETASMWQLVEGRATLLASAWSTVTILRARVAKHVERRVALDKHHLEGASDDVLASVARHLLPTAASSLMRTSRAFAGMQLLRQRLPHLRIRHVEGAFPHGRVISRDNADLAHGVNKPVMRAFVVKRNAVRLYVDFIVNVLRARPLKKLPRKDGLCNKDFDFDDDEYEQAPERAAARGPQPSEMWLYSPMGAHRQAAIDKRHRDAWEAGEGPPEPVDRFSYDKRLPYTSYFRAPLVMTPSLVFADDHSAVPCVEHPGGLALSAHARSKGGTFSQPRQRDVKYTIDTSHPASVKLHVAHLSRDHADRLFKIRVVAKGQLKDGSPYSCTIFSDAFESVGRQEAIGNAGKRGAAADAKAGKQKAQCR